MPHTKGNWKVGKHNSTIVSDSKINLNINGSFSDDSKEYYGGYLIAESVSTCNTKLIALAPKMLDYIKIKAHEGCKDAQTLIVTLYNPKEERPPIGDKQRAVFVILIRHGYWANDIEFLQKQHGWLSVRRINWNKIDESVLNDITPIYPKAYIDYSRDKEVPRYELILE